jgi:signal transduction histidine kinase
MQVSLKLWQQGLILVVLPLAFELCFLGTLSLLLQQSESQARKEAHARAIATSTEHLENFFYQAVATIMLYGRTHRANLSEQYRTIVAKILPEFATLKGLVASDPIHLARVRKNEQLCKRLLNLMNEVEETFEQSDRALALVKLSQVLPEFQTCLSEYVAEVHQLAAQVKHEIIPQPVSDELFRSQVKIIIAIGVAANIVIAISLALYFARGTISRLTTLMDNTTRMVKREPLNPVLAGQDEMAELDHAFHDMASALKEAERLRGEFYAMISHDLRSPLASLSLSMDMLAGGVLGALPEQAYVEAVDSGVRVEQMIRLINDLLDFEKMESGKLELFFRPASAVSIAGKSAASVKRLAQQEGITIEIEVPDVSFYADEDRLVQVVVNLLTNAIKFSPKGSTVKITAQSTSETIEFRVVDRGRGIPADYKDAIFEKFRQVDGSKQAERQGTGLGLPICKIIVEGHGGSLGVESEEEKGSTFWFRIPVNLQHKERADGPVTNSA